MKALSLALALTVATAGGAFAESYPSRPIALIVPFAAGGGTDLTARILAERMRTALGQPIIVENIVGAGGATGVGRAVHAAADGYTIVIGHWGTHVANGAIHALRYDLIEDFEPISLIAKTRWFVIAKKDFAAKDLLGLIAWSKTSPLRFGTGGMGSPEHVSGLFFASRTGARLQFVPYRGGGPALQDLLAGHIDMMIAASTIALPYVKEGLVKAYAITDESRLAEASDIPTVDEAGVPGLYFSSWHGLWAPKGTPKEVIERLNAAVREALAESLVAKRLLDLGQEVFPPDQLTPETLRAHQTAEIEKWWPVIRAANIKVE